MTLLNRISLLSTLLLACLCSGCHRDFMESPGSRPLAAKMVQGFVGDYGLNCGNAGEHALEIHVNGSASLDGQSVVDASHPGVVSLSGGPSVSAESEVTGKMFTTPAAKSLSISQDESGAEGAGFFINVFSNKSTPEVEIWRQGLRASCTFIRGNLPEFASAVDPAQVITTMAQTQSLYCSGNTSGSIAMLIGKDGLLTIHGFPDMPSTDLHAVAFQLKDRGTFSKTAWFGEKSFPFALTIGNTGQFIRFLVVVSLDERGRIARFDYLDEGERHHSKWICKAVGP